MFYATMRDMVIYLHKDEHGFKKSSPVAENLSHCIRIHHALATKATDYRKKQHVFRLQTADAAQYLFQTRLVIDEMRVVNDNLSMPHCSVIAKNVKSGLTPLTLWLPASLPLLSLVLWDRKRGSNGRSCLHPTLSSTGLVICCGLVHSVNSSMSRGNRLCTTSSERYKWSRI